ncbi:hypothetical protein HispidOSU_029158 [Sigmodon hispidus]
MRLQPASNRACDPVPNIRALPKWQGAQYEYPKIDQAGTTGFHSRRLNGKLARSLAPRACALELECAIIQIHAPLYRSMRRRKKSKSSGICSLALIKQTR